MPFEDFAAQHKNIVLRRDQFWIESAPSKTVDASSRMGALVTKEGNNIRVRVALDMQIEKDVLARNATLTAVDHATGSISQVSIPLGDFFKKIGAYTRNGRVLMSAPIDMIFNENGISVLEKGKPVDLKQTEMMDQKTRDMIDCSREIYRLLVLISSANVESNIKNSLAGAGVQDPPGSLHPVRINLTPRLERALFSGNDEEARELLGWTSVDRHKRTYHTKEGPVVRTIEPHDRRIAAPVDRRHVKRILTASDPDMRLELTPDGPRAITSQTSTQHGVVNPVRVAAMNHAPLSEQNDTPLIPAKSRLNLVQRVLQRLGI
jgi:hypothetical protein